MPSLDVSVPFKIPQDEALRRIQALIARMRTQFSDRVKDFQESWNGNVGTFSGSAAGMKISGTCTVNPSDVVVDVDLPLAAMFFSGKIESTIQGELQRILA